MARFGVRDGVGFFFWLKSGSGSALGSLLGRFSNQPGELVVLALWCWQAHWILLRGCL